MDTDEDLPLDASRELDDYDDDKADDPERIARDTKPPLDSTTPEDMRPSNISTHGTGSLGVPTGSGATGAYSSGDYDGTTASDTTAAGGDAPSKIGSA